MPLVSREHTGIDHGGKKNRRSDCNRASSPLSVLLLWRLHSIHNPHIVGPPAITNKQGAAAPTPAGPEMVTVGSDDRTDAFVLISSAEGR